MCHLQDTCSQQGITPLGSEFGIWEMRATHMWCSSKWSQVREINNHELTLAVAIDNDGASRTSLRALFGKKAAAPCPMAASSVVKFAGPSRSEHYHFLGVLISVAPTALPH